VLLATSSVAGVITVWPCPCFLPAQALAQLYFCHTFEQTECCSVTIGLFLFVCSWTVGIMISMTDDSTSELGNYWTSHVGSRSRTVELSVIRFNKISKAGHCRTNPWPAVTDWPWCRNADTGLTHLTTGKYADARLTLFPAFRHLLIESEVFWFFPLIACLTS
jgi:hypothetical protein